MHALRQTLQRSDSHKLTRAFMCACACAYARFQCTRAEWRSLAGQKALGSTSPRQKADTSSDRRVATHHFCRSSTASSSAPLHPRSMIWQRGPFRYLPLDLARPECSVQNETAQQPCEAHRKPARFVLHTYSCCLDVAHIARCNEHRGSCPALCDVRCGAVWSMWSCVVICGAVLCSLPTFYTHTPRHARLMMVVLRGWEVRGRVTEFLRYDACPPTHLI
jgi:hypothetical protein